MAKAKMVHPLRAVREAVALSRSKFARLVGTSESYVEAIEYGSRTMNEELAESIMLRLGIDAESLSPASSSRCWSKPKSAMGGRQLSNAQQIKDCISEWEWHVDHLNEAAPETFENWILPKIRQLIGAATTQRSAVVLSLDKWVAQTIEEFSLKFALRRSADFDEAIWDPIVKKSAAGTWVRFGYHGLMFWSGLASKTKRSFPRPPQKAKCASNARRPSASRVGGNARR